VVILRTLGREREEERGASGEPAPLVPESKLPAIVKTSLFSFIVLPLFLSPCIFSEYSAVVHPLPANSLGQNPAPTSLLNNEMSESVTAQGDPCAICLAPLAKAKEINALRCGHNFHSGCLAELLSRAAKTNALECPICRAPVDKKAIVSVWRTENHKVVNPEGGFAAFAPRADLDAAAPAPRGRRPIASVPVAGRRLAQTVPPSLDHKNPSQRGADFDAITGRQQLVAQVKASMPGREEKRLGAIDHYLFCLDVSGEFFPSDLSILIMYSAALP
jgi:hypothetical protein